MIRLRTAALVLLPLVLVAGCGTASKKPDAETKGPCSYPKDGTRPAKPADRPKSTPPADNPTSMVISTNVGDIKVTFDPDQAPCTVNSFVSLARQGYFDHTPCHRLSTEGYYVLQCGDPMGTGRGGPGYTFADELVQNDPRLQPCGNSASQSYCTYGTGTVAMANRGPDSNGSQFFLVYGSSRFAPDFTVFGRMDAAGLAVVKNVAAKGIGTPNEIGPGDGAPKEAVTIESVK